MAPTTGTSSSFIGRISTAASSRSRLTLDTATYLTGELKVLPRLALLGGRAKEKERVIRYHQRHARGAEMMHLPPQAPERDIGLEQILGRDPPDGQQDPGLQKRNLPLEVGQTLR